MYFVGAENTSRALVDLHRAPPPNTPWALLCPDGIAAPGQFALRK